MIDQLSKNRSFVKTTGKYETRMEWEKKVIELHGRGVTTAKIIEITGSTRAPVVDFLNKRKRY